MLNVAAHRGTFLTQHRTRRMLARKDKYPWLGSLGPHDDDVNTDPSPAVEHAEIGCVRALYHPPLSKTDSSSHDMKPTQKPVDLHVTLRGKTACDWAPSGATLEETPMATRSRSSRIYVHRLSIQFDLLLLCNIQPQ